MPLSAVQVFVYASDDFSVSILAACPVLSGGESGRTREKFQYRPDGRGGKLNQWNVRTEQTIYRYGLSHISARVEEKEKEREKEREGERYNIIN
jgi:hypothetical protein